jgi:hypothetical protein
VSTIAPELVKLVRAENRRQARRKAVGQFAKAVLFHLVVLSLRGLVFMLAVGIVHAEWIHALPTLGYWWSVLLVWLLAGLFSTIKYKENEK